MTRLLTKASDRLLGAVAPKAEASAACTPKCGITDYKCDGYRLYRRTCCLDYYCNYSSCSGWKYVGNSCA